MTTSKLLNLLKLPLTILSFWIIYFFFLTEFLTISPVVKLLDKTTMGNANIVMPLFILFVGLIPFFILVNISKHLVSKNIVSYWFLFVFLFVAPLYLWVAWLNNDFRNSQNVADLNSNRINEKVDSLYEGNKRLQSQVRSLEEKVSMLSAPIYKVHLTYDKEKFKISPTIFYREIDGKTFGLPSMLVTANLNNNPFPVLKIYDLSLIQGELSDPIKLFEPNNVPMSTEIRDILINNRKYSFIGYYEYGDGPDGASGCGDGMNFLYDFSYFEDIESGKKFVFQIDRRIDVNSCLDVTTETPDKRTLEQVLRVIESMEFPY